MSYIRAGSNPEGLYIFGGRRKIEIYGGTEDDKGRYLPRHVFHGVLLRWIQDRYVGDVVRYRSATLTHLLSDEYVSSLKRLEFHKHFGKWALNYKNWASPVIAYETTWFYVAKNVEDRNH